ncbi:cytidine deaminase family protein [Deinococcus koreensis]|uniref:Cytidine deaminase n=1 Tax=Deinococcus koreensis TaxID=2054903 RepID=A0A2K3UWR1_9DEIO|nr:cytidine deaminase [Deinococcus koreensis]PNY80976.1 cytidine deaminase [Deinococcus koreensis]
MDVFEGLVARARAVQGQFVRGDLKAASVAAALQTVGGQVYTGVNIDLACGIGLCAEHSAVSRMLEARETQIDAIVAVWDDGHIFPPCGRCRELLLQVDAANVGTRVMLTPTEVRTLGELMPFRWQEHRGW